MLTAGSAVSRTRKVVVFTIFASHAVPLAVTMAQIGVSHMINRVILLVKYFIDSYILIHSHVIMYQTTGKTP